MTRALKVPIDDRRLTGGRPEDAVLLRMVGGTVRRGGREVLREVTLEVGRKEVVVLLGPNGSGKSTLLLTIAGQLPLTRGELWIAGTEVCNQMTWKRCRERVTLVPQTEYLYEDLTVEENVRVATAYTDRTDRAARRASTAGLWARYFPDVALGTTASQLSTGEARFLSILCGLVRRSRLLMVDEPSAGLSDFLADVALKLLRQAVTDHTSVIIAEQRRDLALGIADRAVLIKGGAIAWQGHSADYSPLI